LRWDSGTIDGIGKNGAVYCRPWYVL
jgi:hypothetical protein